MRTARLRALNRASLPAVPQLGRGSPRASSALFPVGAPLALQRPSRCARVQGSGRTGLGCATGPPAGDLRPARAASPPAACAGCERVAALQRARGCRFRAQLHQRLWVPHRRRQAARAGLPAPTAPTLPPNLQLCVAQYSRGLVRPFGHLRMGHSKRPFWSPSRPGSGSIGREAIAGAIAARRGRPPGLQSVIWLPAHGRLGKWGPRMCHTRPRQARALRSCCVHWQGEGAWLQRAVRLGPWLVHGGDGRLRATTRRGGPRQRTCRLSRPPPPTRSGGVALATTTRDARPSCLGGGRVCRLGSSAHATRRPLIFVLCERGGCVVRRPRSGFLYKRPAIAGAHTSHPHFHRTLFRRPHSPLSIGLSLTPPPSPLPTYLARRPSALVPLFHHAFLPQADHNGGAAEPPPRGLGLCRVRVD